MDWIEQRRSQADEAIAAAVARLDASYRALAAARRDARP